VEAPTKCALTCEMLSENFKQHQVDAHCPVPHLFLPYAWEFKPSPISLNKLDLGTPEASFATKEKNTISELRASPRD